MDLFRSALKEIHVVETIFIQELYSIKILQEVLLLDGNGFL